MAVVVFDADVLIAYLGREDAHHSDAVERVRAALEPGTRRVLTALGYTEILIGPRRASGEAGAAVVDRMLARVGIEVIPVGRDLAARAAGVRAETTLKLPDAFVVATALAAGSDARIESFDKQLVKTFERLT